MAHGPGKRKAEEVASELDRVNKRIETLLREIPTSDHRIIGELYSLIARQDELVAMDTQKESGTMFLDRAQRIAGFLRREYLNALHDGRLRSPKSETTDDNE